MTRGDAVKVFIATMCALLCCALPTASAKPPLEAFGDLPRVRNVVLSPSGNQIAYISRIEGQDLIALFDPETGQSRPLGAVGDLRARDVQFASDKYLIVVVSQYARSFRFRGAWEQSAAFSVDVETGKITQLLRGTDDLFPAQSGLGRIVSIDADGEHVYMPAFRGGPYATPNLDVIKVSLRTGRGLRRGDINGLTSTRDWLVDANGELVAREDFAEREQLHSLKVPDGRGLRTIYSEETLYPGSGLLGVSAEDGSLMLVDARDSQFLSLYSMSPDTGALSEPLMQREDADIESVVTDMNRVVYGVRYSGVRPTYEMFDPELTAAIDAAQRALPRSSVYLESWSDDFSKLIFYVSGGAISERYFQLDRSDMSLKQIASARPEIGDADVGEVMTIEYKARDNLTIPAILTWPAGVPEDQRGNLPLVVLPHGGPEAYDSVAFDWLAQFLANEGYLVLQPNFRGSSGFGALFAMAGYGEWGRKMQTDIEDGARALAAMGWADPERMCIVGWSYGGYAALAGGALTPDLYKCVASIAGVSDLEQMLSDERRQHGVRSATYNYWKLLIGDPSDDREQIRAVSPYRLAEDFQAPVLLIHGDEDLIVPARQSRRMENALEGAGKAVTYIEIDGDDHSLRSNESRGQTLQALGDFLAAHLGN